MHTDLDLENNKKNISDPLHDFLLELLLIWNYLRKVENNFEPCLIS